MTVTLLHNTPLYIAAIGIRKCWASEGKSDTAIEYDGHGGFIHPHKCGPKDKALIERIGNKNKHASTLEHLSYNFDIDGISRACLQELARHRISSFSVKSSRYTLKELKNSEIGGLDKFLVPTGNETIDDWNIDTLWNLRSVLQSNISNDIAKYMLPESYKTSLVWTVNARSLQNFLTLRTNKAALWEIRELANNVFNALPDEHKYLFEHCIYTEEPTNG